MPWMATVEEMPSQQNAEEGVPEAHAPRHAAWLSESGRDSAGAVATGTVAAGHSRDGIDQCRPISMQQWAWLVFGWVRPDTQ